MWSSWGCAAGRHHTAQEGELGWRTREVGEHWSSSLGSIQWDPTQLSVCQRSTQHTAHPTSFSSVRAADASTQQTRSTRRGIPASLSEAPTSPKNRALISGASLARSTASSSAVSRPCCDSPLQGREEGRRQHCVGAQDCHITRTGHTALCGCARLPNRRHGTYRAGGKKACSQTV